MWFLLIRVQNDQYSQTLAHGTLLKQRIVELKMNKINS